MLNKFLAVIAGIKDRPAIAIAIILCAAIIFYAYGCESKTRSLIDPERRVDRQELQNEIDNLINLSRIRFADLQRQDELKKLIFEQTVIVAQGGNVNPVGVLTSLMALLGIGFGVDDVRVRKARKKDLKNYAALKKINSENP